MILVYVRHSSPVSAFTGAPAPSISRYAIPLVEWQLVHLMRTRCHSVAHSEQTRKREPANDPLACTRLARGGDPHTGQARTRSVASSPSGCNRSPAIRVQQTWSAAKARLASAGAAATYSKYTAFSASTSRASGLCPARHSIADRVSAVSAAASSRSRMTVSACRQDGSGRHLLRSRGGVAQPEHVSGG